MLNPHLSLALILANSCAGSLAAESIPVLRALATESTPSLLQNGSFEQDGAGRAAPWRPAPKGFEVKQGEGRDGSRALFCRNESGDGWFGASQTITLNQSAAAPLIIEGWSKAANVTGGSDSEYSLYTDLTYADGTPLWGQAAKFRAGTHDWQQRRLVIFPQKPVRSLTLNCLFRGHGGAVWFDDVSVREARSGADAMVFQGVAVKGTALSVPRSAAVGRSVKTEDGLQLVESDPFITSWVQIGDRRFIHQGPPGGFMVRDVAAESDFYAFRNGDCGDLQFKLSVETEAASDHITVRGRVSDLTGRDRSMTLVYTLPIGDQGWTWGDDLRRTRTISGSGEFVNQVGVPCGATGTQSLYPMAAVWDDYTGAAVGLDMAQPAVCRLGYHAGLKRLFIAFDFGLAKETARFPSSADFSFVLFRFDPAFGFRAAWQKFMNIFPDHFKVRSREQGIWMPFTDVARVQGWEDFGFRYHEGNNAVAWDDAHGILSFRYTEPMTWWMPMAKEVPRTLKEALRIRDSLAASDNANRRRMAEISRTAAMFDDTGELALLFRNEPWADGAVWSLNPNPWLGVPATNKATVQPSTELNGGTVHWNPEIKERLYGASAKGSLDGEYLDSLEGYVTTELNFRRDHFKDTTVPLTFAQETKQLALFKGLSVFEFTRWMADDVHARGKLMFANGVPYRFSYLCPWLDVLGTETDWLRAGKYQPVSLETTDLWRAMSGGKPYVLLMNTDYDQFTPEMVEKYFQRSLFYGMWPGFFSHNAAENPYWQNPRWYNRDRPLFKRYIPLVKRITEAGWQPVAHTTSSNSNLLVERFGPGSHSDVYLTLFNDTATAQSGALAIDLKALGLPDDLIPEALLGGRPERTDKGWRVSLASQEAALWRFGEKAAQR